MLTQSRDQILDQVVFELLYEIVEGETAINDEISNRVSDMLVNIIKV